MGLGRERGEGGGDVRSEEVMARKVCQFGERVRSEMEGWSCVVEILEINFMSSYPPFSRISTFSQGERRETYRVKDPTRL